MRRKMFSVLLAFVLAAGLFPLSAFAGAGDAFLVVLDYQEYDANGKLLRNAVQLLEDGVLGGTVTKEDINVFYNMDESPFVLKHQDLGEIALIAYGHGAKWGDGELEFSLKVELYPVVPGTYELTFVVIPPGYEWINQGVSFTTDQQEIDKTKDGDVEKTLAVKIRKMGSSAPAPAPAPSASAVTAKPTASAVLVNGNQVAFDAYNIGGNNYFKLRDLAYTLSGTEKQFEVGWDGANNSISLTSGKAYTPTGGEMVARAAGDKTAVPTNSKVYLNGKDLAFTAYNIDGNNYFKLRDIGQAFDFGVTWDGAKNTIVIDTSIGYTPEAPSVPATPAQPSSSTDGPVTFSGLREAEYALEDYEWSYGIYAKAKIGPRSGRPDSCNFGFTYWGDDGKKKNTFTASGEGWRDSPPYYEIGFHANLYQVIKGNMPPADALVDGKTYHWMAWVEFDGKKYESAPRTIVFKLPAVLPSTQTKPADPSIRFENMNTLWRENHGFVGFKVGYAFCMEYEFYGGWNYSETGIQCWDSSGREIDYTKSPTGSPKQKWIGSDSSGLANPFFYIPYETYLDNQEDRGSLVPGQTYTWIAYVISDGVRYESPKQTFVFSFDGMGN